MRNKRSQFFLFSALILVGSSIPSTSIPGSFAFSFDKIIHFTEYAIWGTLGLKSNFKIFNSVNIFVLLFGLIFCIFDEIWQSNIPGRDSSLYDVIADFIGIIFSLLLNKYIKKILK
jgi:VanZ family protein